DDDYQDLVLGPGAPVLSVEAAASFGWARWADDSVAIDHFGASAPGGTVLREFGFTGEHVAERAQALLDDLDSDVFDDTEEDA
ncbi:transketolase-like TK C-terminal-containing protein, partial [Vibrio parahaemolyticus]